MKKVLLVILLQLGWAHAESLIHLDVTVSNNREFVAVAVENLTSKDIVCLDAMVMVTHEDPARGVELKSNSIRLGEVYLKASEKKFMELGQDVTDELKKTRDVVFIRTTQWVVDSAGCHELDFLEHLQRNPPTPAEEKFLTIIKKAYKIISNEEVENVLKNTKQIFVVPTRNTLKDPAKRSALEAPMSLSLLRFFPHIEEITLQYLGVDDISGLESLKSLKVLDLARNSNLKNVSGISKNYALKVVDISGTQVSSLDVFRNLSQLKSLNIENTSVSDLGWLMQPNDLECVVFDKLKVRSDDKDTRELLKKSRKTFRECAGGDVRNRKGFFF